MTRRIFALLALAAVIGVFRQGRAAAHAGLRFSDPLEGSTLGDTPAVVRLFFSERPEPSLSLIAVLDTAGASYQIGPPTSVSDDPLALAVRVRPLERGVYSVNWRIVSAVDGHASAGTYAFGVRAAPTSIAGGPPTDAATPWFEMLARWLLLCGLVMIVGAAAVQPGSTRDIGFGVAGWTVACVGLVMLAEAQRGSAAATFKALFLTSIGRALIWRAAAIGGAGVALLAAGWAARGARPRNSWIASTLAGILALVAIAVHAGAGHAAAGNGWLPASVAVVAQWVHFGAAGAWFGGLAALLFGVRGAPSLRKAEAVRRFSRVAAVSLLLVVATGVLRTLGEVASWDDLTSTGYGRAVVVKVMLLCGIAGFAAMNRWRSVPVAAINLRPLRLAGSGELFLAACALAAAAALGALSPPAAALEPVGLIASGSDFGTTVNVRLTTPSDQPGPNRFIVRISDYDTGDPVHAERVSLEFAAVDDPDLAPSMLELRPAPGDIYAGSGANLVFDGRWRITVLIEREGNSVEIPLDVETRGLPQFVSVLRPPGRAPDYTVQVRPGGHVRFTPDPERAGASRIFVTCFDGIYESQPIDDIVVTAAAGSDPVRQLRVERLDRNKFVADLELRRGRNRIAAVARRPDGTRMRATVNLDIP